MESHLLPGPALEVHLGGVVEHQVHELVESHDVALDPRVHVLVQPHGHLRSETGQFAQLTSNGEGQERALTRVLFWRYLKIRLMGWTMTFCTLAGPPAAPPPLYAMVNKRNWD